MLKITINNMQQTYYADSLKAALNLAIAEFGKAANVSYMMWCPI